MFLVFQLQYTHSLYFIECKYLVECKSKWETVLLLESIGQFLIILLPHFIYICNANFRSTDQGNAKRFNHQAKTFYQLFIVFNYDVISASFNASGILVYW